MTIINYLNGNVQITLLDDGTKIREFQGKENVEFPESIDLKITNYCDANCKWCHEMSTINGLHADLNVEFINTLKPGTELAIGGGNPLSHPELIYFLERLKSKEIVANLTVNQYHLKQNIPLLEKLISEKLICGLGISFSFASDLLVDFAQKHSNVVIHVINGLITENQLEFLFNKNLKILILGYKDFGRGIEYNKSERNFIITQNQKYLYRFLPQIIKKFNTVSFDNLAVTQLNVRRVFTSDLWEQFFLGEDGSNTMYIDLVKKEFALNSRSNIRYNLLNNITDMFNIVRV